MPRKAHIFLLLAAMLAQECSTAESTMVPGTNLSIAVPAGWTVLPNAGTQALLRGPGRDATSAPRLAVAASPSDPAAAAAALRDGLLRIADGCEVIDDDQVPLGGRVWRRLRLRFAAGPIVFGQSAWIGAVDGRTLVFVLSAGDDELAAHLATATALIAAVRP